MVIIQHGLPGEAKPFLRKGRNQRVS